MLLAGHGASAVPPTDQLREYVNRTLRMLQDPDLRRESRTMERRTALRGIANEAFDFEEMARRALARHWQARYDVVIEGISLVANYRSPFNTIIQASSYQELVARMRAKVVSVVEGAKEQGTALRP